MVLGMVAIDCVINMKLTRIPNLEPKPHHKHQNGKNKEGKYD